VNNKSPAGRRYLRRFIPTMAAYVVLVFGASFAIDRLELGGPVAWALAIAPSLPILGVIAIMGLYLKEETDEFQRNILIESMLWGFGLTMAVTSVWGFLEIYVDAPALPSFWAFPIFCGAMGLAQPFVRARYK
jgi:hypothetical protein